jgi:hypothetical protein
MYMRGTGVDRTPHSRGRLRFIARHFDCERNPSVARSSVLLHGGCRRRLNRTVFRVDERADRRTERPDVWTFLKSNDAR